MRIHVLGGFLGSGKTSLAIALARHLTERGQRVAIITNDHGPGIVDTIVVAGAAVDTREIAGGRLCCRFDDLDDTLISVAAAGATVVIVEAVGSCADLKSTVVSPLAALRGDRFSVAPLAVAVDPWRHASVERGRVGDEVAYLYRKQIEEADVLLVTHAEGPAPQIIPDLGVLNGHAAILPVSGPSGIGMAEWLAASPSRTPVDIPLDYDRWAAAEAALGWCNGCVRVRRDHPFSAADLADRFLVAMACYPIAHLKIANVGPAAGRASIVCRHDAPDVAFPADLVDEVTWVVNARATLDPASLVRATQAAMSAAARPGQVEWTSVEAFRPLPANPKHRYSPAGVLGG